MEQKSILQNYSNPQARCAALACVNNTNNYIKAKLIQDHLQPSGQVLDMPCGKGGDLKKYRENKSSFYIGIDIVPNNIKEARRRHDATRCMFGAHFMVGDFTQPLDLTSRYDLVSCQFAMHYAWDTEQRARQVMANAAERLKADGVFLVSIPDYNAILSRLESMGKKQDRHNYALKDDAGYTYRIGGEHYWLEFTSSLSFTAFFADVQSSPYGHQYTYYQQGAVDRVPEYLIEPKELARIAALEGLRICKDDNFTCLLERPDQKLLGQMHRTLDLSEEGRDLVGLYRALVLRPAKRRRD